MSSTHRHLLLDFFWQVISGPPCIIDFRSLVDNVAVFDNQGGVFTLENKIAVMALSHTVKISEIYKNYSQFFRNVEIHSR
jgi:hypothetical protein